MKYAKLDNLCGFFFNYSGLNIISIHKHVSIYTLNYWIDFCQFVNDLNTVKTWVLMLYYKCIDLSVHVHTFDIILTITWQFLYYNVVNELNVSVQGQTLEHLLMIYLAFKQLWQFLKIVTETWLWFCWFLTILCGVWWLFLTFLPLLVISLFTSGWFTLYMLFNYHCKRHFVDSITIYMYRCIVIVMNNIFNV